MKDNKVVEKERKASFEMFAGSHRAAQRLQHPHKIDLEPEQSVDPVPISLGLDEMEQPEHHERELE